jgi:hypothetical protein
MSRRLYFIRGRSHHFIVYFEIRIFPFNRICLIIESFLHSSCEKGVGAHLSPMSEKGNWWQRCNPKADYNPKKSTFHCRSGTWKLYSRSIITIFSRLPCSVLFHHTIYFHFPASSPFSTGDNAQVLHHEPLVVAYTPLHDQRDASGVDIRRKPRRSCYD